MAKKHSNAKDKRWEVPIKLPSVEPEDYKGTSSRSNRPKITSGPPAYTLPGHPSKGV